MADATTWAEGLLPELIDRGAVAVALTGSHARGHATPASDLDLIVVGEGPAYLLDLRGGVLVAQSWASEAEHRQGFDDPGRAGATVPGWRQAVVLYDPTGAAARLRREALDWAWDRLGDRADRWVAEEICGYAEEVAKLAAALDGGRRHTAAVQRGVLALRLAPLLAVHHRLLYASENLLWDEVAERMGESWQRAQAAALGIGGESLEAGCAAALALFRLAADRAAALLDERQGAVVAHALAAAERCRSLSR